MALPLMPKATAVWLVENTTLTFQQIADFCGLHVLEVQGIADGEVAVGIVGQDPVGSGQLTREELERCTADSSARLQLLEAKVPLQRGRVKGARYTPVSRRQDRPNAIAWLLKYHPEITDAQISKLVGTTKATINAVRNRTHWNSPNIKLQDPVSLGICSQTELDDAVTKGVAKLRAQEAREAKRAAAAARAAGLDPDVVAAEKAAEKAAAEAPAEDASSKDASSEDAPAPDVAADTATVFGTEPDTADEPQSDEELTAEDVFGDLGNR